jgi:hypothetical protein
MKRLILIASALFMILLPSVGSAQSTTRKGQGLEISPPLRDLKANPGQTVKTTVKVRNVTNNPLDVKAAVNDFTAAGEDGQPKLLLTDQETTPYSIKDWITTISSVTLQPKEQKTVNITMNVPSNASPGGHYGVVRFTGTPPGESSNAVALSASIGALILVRVSGNIQELASVEQFYTAQNNHQRWLFEYGPVDLVQRIKNTGNVHIKPSGTVRVTNTFGRETATLKINEGGGNILPSSIRKFQQTLNKKLLFGRYKAQADIVYGSKNTILVASTVFWVIPYKLIAIILALIALLIFGIKRYNRYVIKRSHRR